MRKVIVFILKKLHLYYFALRVQRMMYRVCFAKEIKKKVQSTVLAAEKEIDSIKTVNNKEIVYIFQYTYYTTDGQSYISGGGERYASDLSNLIFNMGYQPILIQFGTPESKDVWQVKRGELYVLGLNINPSLYTKVIEQLPKPKLALYSGYVDFGEHLFSPNIMISHGITWDEPSYDVSVERIKKILLTADELVSVDTNTISWLRSTFSQTLAEKKVRMHYVPNYTDIDKYKPNDSLKDKDHIKVIFPRRCSPERGFWLITKVLPQLMDKYENLIFDYVGFIHTEDIGQAIEQLKEKYIGRVNHYFVDADEMYKVYQAADISLIPTLYCEGTSLSCIEAMACGNVVISTNIGGLPNLIIDRYNGRLVNPNMKDLLDALDEVIGDVAARKIMSEKAIEVSKVFSKSNWEERWRKILFESLKGNSK